MKVALLCLSAILVLIFWPQTAATQDPQKPEELAQKSAEAWLALVDAGRYGDSWDEAATTFKTAVTKEHWVSTLHNLRAPLGAVQSRKFKSAAYTKNPHRERAGEYVVIQFDTSYKNKRSGVETITPMLDKDGQWRVSGYFFR